MSGRNIPQEDQIITLRAEVSQLQEQLRALGLVVSWLLAHNPESHHFLSLQATELEGNPEFVEDVALLNELGEDVLEWQTRWRK